MFPQPICTGTFSAFTVVLASWNTAHSWFILCKEWKFMLRTTRNWLWNHYWSGLGILISSLQLKHLDWKPQFRYFLVCLLIKRRLLFLIHLMLHVYFVSISTYPTLTMSWKKLTSWLEFAMVCIIDTFQNISGGWFTSICISSYHLEAISSHLSLFCQHIRVSNGEGKWNG